MKAVVAAFNQEKALVGAFSVITNLRMELFEALVFTQSLAQLRGRGPRQPSLLVYIIRHIFARVRGAALHSLHTVLPHHALRQHRGPGQGRGRGLRGEAAQTVWVCCDDDAMLSLPPSSQDSFRGHKHGDIDE